VTEARFSLVSDKALLDLMEQVHFRLDAIPTNASRYAELASVAAIHQESSASLSDMIYADAKAGRVATLACRAGCSLCCIIPSKARGPGTFFRLSILDAVTLVEHYAEFKAAQPAISDRAIQALADTKSSTDMVLCPYLTKDGQCGIYLHRPVSCKIWFSADLQLCSDNKAVGYRKGINAKTDESNRLLDEFQKPFVERVKKIAPELRFHEHDFIESFDEVARLDQAGLFDMFKLKINSGELASWNLFDGPSEF